MQLATRLSEGSTVEPAVQSKLFQLNINIFNYKFIPFCSTVLPLGCRQLGNESSAIMPQIKCGKTIGFRATCAISTQLTQNNAKRTSNKNTYNCKAQNKTCQFPAKCIEHGMRGAKRGKKVALLNGKQGEVRAGNGVPLHCKCQKANDDTGIQKEIRYTH